jgi:hypothetical protein
LTAPALIDNKHLNGRRFDGTRLGGKSLDGKSLDGKKLDGTMKININTMKIEMIIND